MSAWLLSDPLPAGSVWDEECRTLCEAFAHYFIELRADGHLGYNSAGPARFTYDGDDSWRVDKGRLVLDWTNGTEVTRFEIGDNLRELKGTEDGTGSQRTLKRIR